MKKTMKIAGLMALVMMLFVVTTAFTSVNKAEGDDYSCKVTITYSDGSAAAYVKVTTEVSGGLSCLGGRNFETNKNGEVTLLWASGCKLKTIYVKGDAYSVDYKDGGKYKLMLN